MEPEDLHACRQKRLNSDAAKKAEMYLKCAVGCRISGLDYASPESRVTGRLDVSVLAEDCVGAF